MMNVLAPPTPTVRTSAARGAAGSRSRLGLELREVAHDLAGRVDRDELTPQEELALADALDAAVDAALPQVLDALDRELTPRLEALSLHIRLGLVRARGRREFGRG